MRSCNQCSHRFYKDYGYSDYTVEGTDIYCRNDLNPDYPHPEPYKHEEQKGPHAFAENCPSYQEEEPVGFDVPHFSVEEDIEFEDGQP